SMIPVGGYVFSGVKVVRKADNTIELLQKAANKADKAVPGSGPVAGTKKHTVFKQEVKKLDNPLLDTEVTYLNGKIENYGTKGGVRLDVVEYNPDGTIKAVYDLKTGGATLSPQRIDQILTHILGPGIPNPGIPVTMIKPQ
ncbi:MAG: hypothetical protein IBX64_07740, partial [Actinobacteria bacterium]|nr:hypothetical protein [Actinomycetota bacterium]